jgi:dipicolinate synthase subunit A
MFFERIESGMEKQCLLIGGDKRQRFLADDLLQDGFKVYCYGLERCLDLPQAVVQVDTLLPTPVTVFPIPITKDGQTVVAPYSGAPLSLEWVIDKLSPTTTLFGGMFPLDVREALEKRGISFYDYGLDEEFNRLNAIPSAEGAIEIAMHNTPYTLQGASVCVVGFGRIGKALVTRLLALGCKVTATARRAEQLSEITALGAIPLFTDNLACSDGYDILFNTVPAPVVHSAVLERLSPTTLVIDLASKPGGVDFDTAVSKGIRCIHALSLPALCAPKTAAQYLYLTIKQHFNGEVN